MTKPCSRIEGLYVPCGGGGGGCGCPTKESCTEPTFEHTCTSPYDGSQITQSCPTCCFTTKCDEIKDTMECRSSKSICGKTCQGTLARTDCPNTSCPTYKASSYTRAVYKTTSECLEEREYEIFECSSSGSADGCTCNCQKSGNGCQVVSSGICNGGQCSCGKTGSQVVKECVKYKQVCDRVDTVNCKVVDKQFPKVGGSGCSCVCPPDYTPSPPDVVNLPACGTSTTCTPGACTNC